MFKSRPYRSNIKAAVRDLAGEASKLSLELCDVAGNVESAAARVAEQSALCDDLREAASTTRAGSRDIATAASEMQHVNALMNEELRASRAGVDASAQEILDLIAAVEHVSGRLGALNRSLSMVRGVAEEISVIARKTHLLALNASIEAARAGEAGKSFGVVAIEVKGLAGITSQATTRIEHTLHELTSSISELVSIGGANSARASRVREQVGSIKSIIDGAVDAVGELQRNAESIAGSTRVIAARGTELEQQISRMVDGVHESSADFDMAQSRIRGVLGVAEHMTTLTALTGIVTDDTPFIEAARNGARKVEWIFSAAISGGSLTIAQLFDDKPRLIEGTDPQQWMAEYTSLADDQVRPLLAATKAMSDRIRLSSVICKTGYVPTHLDEFSKPPGPDREWNAAHCRNRRFYQDDVALASALNAMPFLLQTVRPPLGETRQSVMKDVSVPIYVKGRHWGAFRVAYRAISE